MSSELYQQVIIDHNKNPRNFGTLKRITHGAEGHNPLCGDHIFIDLFIEDSICSEITFRGESCAICKSCASLLTDEIKGKSIDKVKQTLEVFNQFILREKKQTSLMEELLGKKLVIFSNIWNYPARIKCVLLPVKTINVALENKVNKDIEKRKSAKTE